MAIFFMPDRLFFATRILALRRALAGQYFRDADKSPKQKSRSNRNPQFRAEQNAAPKAHIQTTESPLPPLANRARHIASTRPPVRTATPPAGWPGGRARQKLPRRSPHLCRREIAAIPGSSVQPVPEVQR